MIPTAEQDKQNTHAVFFDDCLTVNSHVVAARIAVGMMELNQRAMKAEMVIVSTTIIQNSYADPKNGAGHVCTTAICQWIGREKLESMQRQQALLGNQNGGAR